MTNHKKKAIITCTCNKCKREFEVNNLMDILENRNPSMIPYSAKASSSKMWCSCGGSDFKLNYGWNMSSMWAR